MEGFVIVDAVGAGEYSHLGVHRPAGFSGFFDFFGDFLVVFVFEGASDDDGEADDNKKDGEDDFPGDVVVEDVPSS